MRVYKRYIPKEQDVSSELNNRYQEVLLLKAENQILYIRYSDDQPRDDHGRWTDGGGSGSSAGAGTDSDSDSGLTDGGDNGTIDLSDSSNDFQPVTQEAIDSVPDITCFDDPKLNEAVTENCKQILIDVKDEPIGTEKTVSINMHTLEIKGKMGERGTGMVKPIKMSDLYISIHNHPSGETISVYDLDCFCCDSKCRGIVVVGNNGKIYSMIKTNSFDSTGFFEHMMRKRYGYDQYDSDSEFLKGAESYGVRYNEETN